MYSASGVCSAARASSETIYEGGAGAEGGGTGSFLRFEGAADAKAMVATSSTELSTKALGGATQLTVVELW